MKNKDIFSKLESKKLTSVSEIFGGKGTPVETIPSYTMPGLTINSDGTYTVEPGDVEFTAMDEVN